MYESELTEQQSKFNWEKKKERLQKEKREKKKKIISDAVQKFTKKPREEEEGTVIESKPQKGRKRVSFG